MIVADEQILAGSSATITGRFRDQDGDLVDPTGPVTVTVTRSDGTPVLTAAATTTPSGTVGVRQAALNATQNSVAVETLEIAHEGVFQIPFVGVASGIAGAAQGQGGRLIGAAGGIGNL